MIEGKFEAVTVIAGADLSAMQYKIVTVGGVMSAANITALGVLQNDPLSGEHASVAYRGNMKAYAGGTIAAGNTVVLTASGTLAVGSDGVIGKALSAASSGGLVNFVGDFSVAG